MTLGKNVIISIFVNKFHSDIGRLLIHLMTDHETDFNDRIIIENIEGIIQIVNSNGSILSLYQMIALSFCTIL